MFCNLLLQLNMPKRRHIFKHFGPWNEEKVRLAKNKIGFDLELLKGDLSTRI